MSTGEGSLWSGSFWKATAERAVRTAAQTAGALLIGNALTPLDVDWGQIGAVSGMASLLSVLTAVGTGFVPGNTGPGLTEVPTGKP